MQPSTPINPDLLHALILVESGGDDFAIGDKLLRNKAYGCLQIRQPYMDDVNRVFNTSHLASSCLGNRALSLDTVQKYMTIYANRHRLGREVTDQDRARIHNGGPNGYELQATIKYWQRVQKYLQ